MTSRMHVLRSVAKSHTHARHASTHTRLLFLLRTTERCRRQANATLESNTFFLGAMFHPCHLCECDTASALIGLMPAPPGMNRVMALQSEFQGVNSPAASRERAQLDLGGLALDQRKWLKIDFLKYFGGGSGGSLRTRRDKILRCSRGAAMACGSAWVQLHPEPCALQHTHTPAESETRSRSLRLPVSPFRRLTQDGGHGTPMPAAANPLRPTAIKRPWMRPTEPRAGPKGIIASCPSALARLAGRVGKQARRGEMERGGACRRRRGCVWVWCACALNFGFFFFSFSDFQIFLRWL